MSKHWSDLDQLKMRFPGQIETPDLRGLICILTIIIPQDVKQEMRQSTGSACGRGRGRGRGRGKRTRKTPRIAPKRACRTSGRNVANPRPPGTPVLPGPPSIACTAFLAPSFFPCLPSPRYPQPSPITFVLSTLQRASEWLAACIFITVTVSNKTVQNSSNETRDT